MESFEEAVHRLAYQKPIVTVGTVTEVNGYTCKVSRVNLPPLLDVRLNSIVQDLNNYMTIVPKIGSKVLCLVIEGKRSETTIVKYSEIESIQTKVEGAEFVMRGGKFVFKNEQADLKQAIVKGLTACKDGIIQTATGGPGAYNLASKKLIQDQIDNINKIFE